MAHLILIAKKIESQVTFVDSTNFFSRVFKVSFLSGWQVWRRNGTSTYVDDFNYFANLNNSIKYNVLIIRIRNNVQKKILYLHNLLGDKNSN